MNRQQIIGELVIKFHEIHITLANNVMKTMPMELISDPDALKQKHITRLDDAVIKNLNEFSDEKLLDTYTHAIKINPKTLKEYGV